MKDPLPAPNGKGIATTKARLAKEADRACLTLRTAQMVPVEVKHLYQSASAAMRQSSARSRPIQPTKEGPFLAARNLVKTAVGFSSGQMAPEIQVALHDLKPRPERRCVSGSLLSNYLMVPDCLACQTARSHTSQAGDIQRCDCDLVAVLRTVSKEVRLSLRFRQR